MTAASTHANFQAGKTHQGQSAHLRVLLVDDSALTRQFTLSVLNHLAEQHPMTVDTAECGEDSLDMALDSQYDLILMDVEMPGIGGLKACEMLKKRQCDARIVMLSGRTSAEAHREGRGAGCDNYLTKPVNEADLRSIVSLIELKKGLA
ncbi:MAG: response regulator [Alcanivoracaceae bacterium]|nr:response regulator [Alcanivoracaceae bacterium]